MSEENLVDQLKKWLEYDDESKSTDDPMVVTVEDLKKQLAMEEDPEKRESIKKQIESIEDSEDANLPSNITGPYQEIPWHTEEQIIKAHQVHTLQQM